MKVRLPDEQASECLGTALARTLGAAGASPSQGVQLDLRGPLGAGKTTVTRALLRSLGVTGPVRSPTYTLIEPYEADGWQIMHYDLYRIADGEELELLGAREHFRRGVLRCVEWPERAADWLLAPDLELVLEHRDEGRCAVLIAGSAFGCRWLSAAKGQIDLALS